MFSYGISWFPFCVSFSPPTWPGKNTDPYNVHTKIQNTIVDLHDKYRHFTPITLCTNFVLDTRVSVRPANAIDTMFTL